MSKYTHKVTRNGDLCSEHKSEANARKAVAQLVSMSKGKLTENDFVVEPIEPKPEPEEERRWIRPYCRPPVAKRWTRPARQRYSRFLWWRTEQNLNFLEGL